MADNATNAITTNVTAEKIENLKTMQKARKVRVGLLYAALCAPLLGVAFGFAGVAGGMPPFDIAFPTGSMSFQFFEYMFGCLAILLYSFAQGSAKDHLRIFKSKISWYGVMVGMAGMLGDFLYFAAAALVGGAIVGPVASLFGFWGAVITSLVYREKMRNKWTIMGLGCIIVGCWVAAGGAEMVAPDGASTSTIILGAVMGLGASICYGLENFAIAAGSDFMNEESTLMWRAGWAVIGCIVLNFAVMPHFNEIGYQMFTTPWIWAYAAMTGGAWSIYMIASCYIGINTAGTSGGGVLASTGLIWATFLSMTVYGVPFSLPVAIGTCILFAGVAITLIRPSKVIAKLR
jgi:drug/metabolite transporter (DMT)-like permease